MTRIHSIDKNTQTFDEKISALVAQRNELVRDLRTLCQYASPIGHALDRAASETLRRDFDALHRAIDRIQRAISRIDARLDMLEGGSIRARRFTLVEHHTVYYCGNIWLLVHDERGIVASQDSDYLLQLEGRAACCGEIITLDEYRHAREVQTLIDAFVEQRDGDPVPGLPTCALTDAADWGWPL